MLAAKRRDLREELRGIARGSFESLGRLVADFAQMGRWEASDLDRHVRWEGWEHYQKAQARGRGVLYLAAHFGSWEVVSFAQSLRGAPMAFIVRPADNLRIEALVRARRERHGNAVIPKRSALRDCLRRLKRGETVGILIDQHVPAESGVVSQLLGQPVYTTSALALLALRTGAPVLPAFALRQADGTQRIILGPEIDLERSGDPARDVIVATQRFNEAVERFIAERPDHWLWAHRRFRAAAHAGGGTPRGTQAE